MSEERKLENWLHAYEKFTLGTESPLVFHRWVGLGTLAGAMQRKIHIDFGYYQVHSNFFIVLVAPPGHSRKSTALRIGQGILEGVKDAGGPVHFSTQASSQAALVQQLSKIEDKTNQSLTCFSSELGSLLGSKSVEIVDFLTDIYDCNPNWSKQTVARGLEKIEKPWLNVVAATTPQWMGDNLSKTAVEGGFVSRCIFVYCDEVTRRVAFPELTDEQREIKKSLVHDLKLISESKGEFVLTPEAKEYYREWYEDDSRILATLDYRVVGFYEREHIQVLKVAMAVSMAESSRRVIEKKHIEEAIVLLNQIKPGMHKAFTAVGKNPFSVEMERMKDMLRRFPAGLSYKQLFAANRADLDVKQFDLIVQTLIAVGDFTQQPGGKYVLTSNTQGKNETTGVQATLN